MLSNACPRDNFQSASINTLQHLVFAIYEGFLHATPVQSTYKVYCVNTEYATLIDFVHPFVLYQNQFVCCLKVSSESSSIDL